MSFTSGNKLALAIATSVLLMNDAALALNHSYITTMRSNTAHTIFVSQSIDGEFGHADVNGTTAVRSEAGEQTGSAHGTVKQMWQGFGIGTQFGLELMKFIQFNAGHTFVNLRNKDDSLQALDGSRFNLGSRLVFTAPIGNLEFGGGMLASKLDYRDRLENATLYGSGYYYSVGLNYFLSSQVSLYGNAKMNYENLIRNGGSALTSSIKTSTTLLGVGFTLWLY